MTGSGGHRFIVPTTTAKGFAPGWLEMMPDAEYSMNGSPVLEGGFSDPASIIQHPASGIGCKSAGFVGVPCRSGHECMSERARDDH
ncbi:MAG: hypothetical protein HGB17_04775 [Syntrophobacteraceae bacterium]|nr:hypothetical protein [Syntrophobacteraceae bacterium]